jgi:hypothetical protein
MRGVKILLVISGVLGLGIGAAVMFSTASFVAGLGLTIDDRVATMGQAQGALLIALGAMNLFASRAADPAAVRPVLFGNLVAQLVSMGVNIRAGALGLVSSQVWGSVAMHVVLAGLFGYFLSRPAK